MERMDLRVARLREFFAVDQTNSDLACELADALLAQGEASQADAVLAALPSRESVGVRFRIARCALAQGRYAASESLLRGLIEDGHSSVAVLHDLAFAQLCQRQVDTAAATLEHAIASHGETHPLYVLAARVAMMRARHDEAAAHAEAALSLLPDDPQAQGVLALALFDGGHSERAAYVARTCLEHTPDQHEALLVASTLALWTQDLDSAQALYEVTLSRHPNSGRALSGYGQVAMLRSDLARAHDILQAAVRAMPDHIGTWHALAWTQLLLGQRDAAESSYQSAYAVDRNFGDTHGGLALIAAMRGDHAAAEQGIQRALRLDPDAFTARYAKSLLLEARGDSAGAEAIMTQLLQSAPPNGVPVREFGDRLKQTLRLA